MSEKELVVVPARHVGQTIEMIKRLRPEIVIQQSDCQEQRDALLAALEKAAEWMLWIKLREKCTCEPNSRCVKCVVTDELVIVEAAIAATGE